MKPAPIILNLKIMIQLHDKQFVPVGFYNEIDFAITKLANQDDFTMKLLFCLKFQYGSFIGFRFDEKVQKPCEITFIKMAL